MGSLRSLQKSKYLKLIILIFLVYFWTETVILQKSLCLVKMDNFSNVNKWIYECRSEKLSLPQLTQNISVSVTVIDPTEAPVYSENGNGNSGSQHVTLQSFFIIVLTLVLIWKNTQAWEWLVILKKPLTFLDV